MRPRPPPPSTLDLPNVGSPISICDGSKERAVVRFEVEKMGCAGCAKSVTQAVQAVEPAARVAVDLAAKRVTVTGAAGPADRIAQAITAAGYPAVTSPA